MFYISDLHFNHKNIIKYCERPFDSVEQMNELMLSNLREVDALGETIYFLGDMSLNFRKFVAENGWLDNCKNHVCVIGNHDPYPKQREAYDACFGQVVGVQDTWQTNQHIFRDAGTGLWLLLSHNPQKDLQGCDYNLYGHVHNNVTRDERFRLQNPDRADENNAWVNDSDKHINCCVEMIGFKPRTLTELLEGWE